MPRESTHMSKKDLSISALLFIGVIAAAVPFIGRAENTTDDEPQVISLQLNRSGFEPGETIAHRGKFLILLQNRSGQRDLNFWLARENQERLAESEPQKRDWKAQVQLGPGTYVVGESSHPEWKAIIHVTN
jgi:hypothetical protein